MVGECNVGVEDHECRILGRLRDMSGSGRLHYPYYHTLGESYFEGRKGYVERVGAEFGGSA